MAEVMGIAIESTSTDYVLPDHTAPGYSRCFALFWKWILFSLEWVKLMFCRLFTNV